MRKIKINLTSGNIIEKPLLTAFKGTYGDYIVLDNESVGSMGLPVILISKIQDNKISTIADANEWNAIKDNLRNLIAGNQIIKVNVLDEYTGEDIYYKQLTLPVASFEALKNTYGENSAAPASPTAPVASDVVPIPSVDATPAAQPAVEPAPVIPETPMPPETAVVEPAMPSVSVAPMPEVTPAPTVEPAQVMPEAPMTPEVPVVPVAPEMPAAPEATAAEPVMPDVPMAPMLEVAPIPTVEPVVEPVPSVMEQATPVDLTTEKEAFLKACENMFDALASKFNK